MAHPPGGGRMVDKARGDGNLPVSVLVLLAVAVAFNAGDRGSLSTVAPVLSRELGISNTELGVLLSAFFWVYAPGQLVAGWLAERFSTRLVIAGGFFVWAAATLATGFAGGFAGILVLRLLLGAGESTLFPAASKLLAATTTASTRGTANAVFLLGLSVGPSVGTLLGGALLASHGWRVVFFVFGFVSLLWLVPWMLAPVPRTVQVAGDAGAPSYRRILAERAAWGMAIGHFCANYMGYFLLTWLPKYLVDERHLSLSGMAWTGALIFGAESCGSLLCGWASDRAIAGGRSESGVRRFLLVAGTAGIAVFMLATVAVPADFAIPCLVAAAISRGAQIPAMYAVAQAFSGPRAGGRWMGFENFVGNLAGIVAPVATGVAIDLTGRYTAGFVLVAVFSVVGVVCWRFVIGPVREIEWA